jgi:hypothetical protein
MKERGRNGGIPGERCIREFLGVAFFLLYQGKRLLTPLLSALSSTTSEFVKMVTISAMGSDLPSKRTATLEKEAMVARGTSEKKE